MAPLTCTVSQRAMQTMYERNHVQVLFLPSHDVPLIARTSHNRIRLKISTGGRTNAHALTIFPKVVGG